MEARYGLLIIGASDVVIDRVPAGSSGDSYTVRRGPRAAGVGSAVAIDARGYFVTAAHNLATAGANIFVLHFDGKVMQVDRGRVVWKGDFETGGPDLGLIKIERELNAVAQWALGVKPGDAVLGIGPVGGPLPSRSAPLSRERGYYAGEVIGQVPVNGTPGWEKIEHTAPARSGDSGGPVFNQRGELIGVHSASAYGGRSLGPIRWYTGSAKHYAARPLDHRTISTLIEQDYREVR